MTRTFPASPPYAPARPPVPPACVHRARFAPRRLAWRRRVTGQVGKLPTPEYYLNTMRNIRKQGLQPLLEDENGQPRYVPRRGFRMRPPDEDMAEWPGEDPANIDLPLAWDENGRTKWEVRVTRAGEAHWPERDHACAS
jgi:hypothetical protein